MVVGYKMLGSRLMEGKARRTTEAVNFELQTSTCALSVVFSSIQSKGARYKDFRAPSGFASNLSGK